MNERKIKGLSTTQKSQNLVFTFDALPDVEKLSSIETIHQVIYFPISVVFFHNFQSKPPLHTRDNEK